MKHGHYFCFRKELTLLGKIGGGGIFSFSVKQLIKKKKVKTSKV